MDRFYASFLGALLQHPLCPIQLSGRSSDREGQATRSYQGDKPRKRVQDGPQTSRRIFLTEVILFTQIDNDFRDFREFVRHYLTFLFILFYFLEAYSSAYLSGDMCKTYIPHGKCSKQETRDGGDRWELGCQGAPRENREGCLYRTHCSIIMRADLPSWGRDGGNISW